MNKISKGILRFLISVLLICLFVFVIFTAIGNLFPKIDLFGWLASLNSPPEPYEVVSLDNGFHGLSNGGLTPEEVEKFSKDDTLPYSDDVFRDFYFRESPTHVFVSRTVEEKYNTFYPTILFVKTEKGLIWDGAVNVSASVAWRNFFTGQINFDTLEFYTHFNNPLQSMGRITNLTECISFSNFNSDFCSGWNSPTLAVWVNPIDTLYNRIHKWLYDNVVLKYFVELTDLVTDGTIELRSFKYNAETDSENKNFSIFNSYITHLWQESKTTEDKESYSLVDLSSYFNKYIPAEYKVNYPLPADKLLEYPGHEFYPMFSCKVVARVTSIYKADDFVGSGNKLIQPKSELYEITPTPTVVEELAELKLILKNKDNSDLSQFSISNTPVTIKIGDMPVIFKTMNDLNSGKSIAVSKGKLHYYEIVSDGLVFANYTGSLAVNDNFVSKTFEFTYQHGYVYTQVSLAQISATNPDDINLERYPVRIVFNGKNGEGTYQFVFDKNSSLDTAIGQYLKQGSYEYSVLSERLIFSSTNGNIDINANSRKFTFNYSVNKYQNDLKFSVTTSTTAITSGSDIAISATTQTVNLLASSIGNAGFQVVVKIFNADGYILFNKTHSHLAGSACSDAWDSNGVLAHGTEYTGQLLYINPADTSKSYVSGTFNFVYTKNTKFTFTYSCVKV